MRPLHPALGTPRPHSLPLLASPSPPPRQRGAHHRDRVAGRGRGGEPAGGRRGAGRLCGDVQGAGVWCCLPSFAHAVGQSVSHACHCSRMHSHLLSLLSPLHSTHLPPLRRSPPRRARWRRSTSTRCWPPKRPLTILRLATRRCARPTRAAGAPRSMPGGLDEEAACACLQRAARAPPAAGAGECLIASSANPPSSRAPQVPAAAGAQAGPSRRRLRAAHQRGRRAPGGSGAQRGRHAGEGAAGDGPV